MKAGEYHETFRCLVAQPLVALDWVERKGRLFRHVGRSVAALLRIETKFSSLAKQVAYVLTVRHDFLRNLEGETAEAFLDDPNEYPVKIMPSTALRLARGGAVWGWRYQPINSGIRDTDDIWYGQEARSEVEAKLVALCRILREFVPPFQEYLAPKEAFRQIEQYGEGAYCEKLWLQDYQAFLGQPQ